MAQLISTKAILQQQQQKQRSPHILLYGAPKCTGPMQRQHTPLPQQLASRKAQLRGSLDGPQRSPPNFLSARPPNASKSRAVATRHQVSR
jgi:hypothetical protein